MQGDDPKYLKTVATAKHFAVHSGPEPARHSFDAVVSEKDLRETYLPHFEAAIRDGGAYSVMCAYNSVDGLPACSNPRLLEDILRKEWGFKGYVVSDCGAIGDIYLNHKKAPNAEAGVARAIQAGTDLNCGIEYGNALTAVRNGLLAESDVDKALRRLLTARFKLGMFDPPAMVKYAQIPYSQVDSVEHRALALETARKSIVLLKNDRRVLPLSKSLKTLAVIGPSADDSVLLLGNYNGIPAEPITPLEGIRRKLGSSTRIIYAPGSEIAANMPRFEVIPASALKLQGEYFASSNFDGKRHRPRELTVPTSGQLVGDIPQNPQPLFTRADPQVNFDWLDGAPRPGMNDDDFGVRWTGFLTAPVTGTYQLGAAGKNAFELYLDGKQVVATNTIHGGRTYQYAAVELEAGKQYPIRLDFHSYLNDAAIQMVWSRPGMIRESDALDAARQADAVVMVMGLSPRLEGEEMRVQIEGFQGGDRVQIGLPRVQEELMQRVAALGKPTVLVLLNGSAVAVNWAKDHIPAIVEVWYPGQAGGTALADVLFGDYNPGGRLPVTFYKSVDQLPPFTDYRMEGRTYRFFKSEPLFPFGYGLSYSTFAYRKLNSPGAFAGQQVNISLEVENTSLIAGEEVVQLYVKRDEGGPVQASRSLAGFRRVALRPRERKTVRLSLMGQAPGTLLISVGGLTRRIKIGPPAAE
jgi:beta-glucosidase